MTELIESSFGSYDPDGNILIEFKQGAEQDMKIVGREIRRKEIVESHGSVDNVIDHLLRFYNVKGNVNVLAIYEGNVTRKNMVM